MRNNSALWIGLIAAGGLLVAALAGMVGVAMMKSWPQKRVVAQAPPATQREHAAAPTAKAAEVPAAAPAPEPTALDLWKEAPNRETAEGLYKAYQGNAVAADQKYKGKGIALVGVVQKVETDPAGNGILVLKAGDLGELSGLGDLGGIGVGFVTCRMVPADTSKLAPLAEGHAVALVGTGKGKLLTGIMVEKCHLLHAARNMDELRKAFK
jgi:hypothetical protein